MAPAGRSATAETGLDIGIVGGGLGGLTLALALHEAGFRRICVYEAAAAPPAGAWALELPPNAARVLHALGLKAELAAIAAEPSTHLTRAARSGYLIAQRPLGGFAAARYGAPHYLADHAALLRLLASTAQARGVELVAAARCTGLELVEEGVALAFANGEPRRHGVVVGCDGRHSAVREALGYRAAERPLGLEAWRGSAPAAAVPRTLADRHRTTWLGPGALLTHHLDAGGNRVAFTALVPESSGDLPPGERDAGWGSRASGDALAARLAGWHPHVRELVTAAGDCRRWRVAHRDPISQWYHVRVALLGDACHAQPPYLALGEALAVEDAWVLSRMLERWEDEPTAAFEEYQRYRKPRVARASRNVRRLRDGQLTVEPRTALWRNLRMAVASRFLPEIAMQQLDWLYGYDCIRGFD